MIDIKNKEECCGCTACYSVCPKKCIVMESDEEGFLYPKINEKKCINCHLCEKICPIKNTDIINRINNKGYIVRNKNSEIVKTSTSGGIVSAICEEIINQNGIVYGACFDDDFNVIHTCAKNVHQLEKFKTSKYVQSLLSNTFINIKENLNNDDKVLFIGTPCQVAGLKKYLIKDYNNLFTIDFACHGVPSPMIWQKYMQFQVNKHNSKIIYANFREKTYGYHSSNMSIRFKNNKKSLGNIYTDYMLKSYFDGLCSRPSCYKCNFKNDKNLSDITVFDCWNINYYKPQIKDDDNGYTCLITHNQKAEEILEIIKPNAIIYKEDYKKLIKKDGVMLTKQPIPHNKRKEFFQLINKGVPIDKVIRELSPITIKRKFIDIIKILLFKLKLLNIAKKL